MLGALVLVAAITSAAWFAQSAFRGESAPDRAPTRAALVKDRHLSKETPYGIPHSSIKVPPKGYSMFFIENIGRHGSRTAVSASAERRVLEVWTAASKSGGLTARGESLGPNVKSLQLVERRIGYGNLSGLGRAEWRGIGTRLAADYGHFFASLRPGKDEVQPITTTVRRTQQSMAALESGLRDAHENLPIAAPGVDDRLIDLGTSISTHGAEDLEAIKRRPEVVGAARDMLTRIYTPAYVKGLGDPVDKAMDIYSLYCTSASLGAETTVSFDTYVTEVDAAIMEDIRDAGLFYRYGPGIADENTSYGGAKVLRSEFFAALDERIAGGKNAAVFRIAHGETLMPFAALLGLPGSRTHTTGHAPYSHRNNPWRGSQAGRLAGNIEWVGYRNSRNHYIVTMRDNEVPARFGSGCKPTTRGGYFYTPSELKRCLPTS